MGARHDRMMVAVLIGVFILLSYGISRHRARQVEPGFPEYANYIEDRIAACIRERLAAHRGDARGEQPLLASPSEREATCRFVVHQVDRLHPESRPYLY